MSIFSTDKKVYISGNSGIYNQYVQNPSARFGRNAAADNAYYTHSLNPPAPKEPKDNSIESTEKYIQDVNKYIDSLPPLEFEYRYMPQNPNGAVDKMALMGAAYEELQAPSVSVDALNKPLKDIIKNDTSPDSKIAQIASETDASVLDINHDGQVDIAEYGASILASDILSKQNGMNTSNITGVINNKGLNSQFFLLNKKNADYARRCFVDLAYLYNLPAARDAFILDRYNTINLNA